MMSKMKSGRLDRKLKLERIEVCLNCKNFLNCESIGKFEECEEFVEVEGETWVIRKM